MSEIVLYPTDENEDKIWDKIEAYVNEEIEVSYKDEETGESKTTKRSVFADAKVKEAILGVVQFERKKQKNHNIIGKIPSAPFAVAGPDYTSDANKKAAVRVALQSWVKFRNLVDMLKTKTLSRDARFVSEHLQRIELVLNPARITINGEDVVLRETPLSDPSKCVLKVTVKAMCKKHGRRVLDVTWNGFNAIYRVQLLQGDDVKQEATVKGGRKQFVLRDDMDTSGYYIKLMHPDDNDAEKQGPFDCPRKEVELASVSSELYDIDKFRLEICGKYKTVFDLLELVKCPEYSADGAAVNIVEALDFLRKYVKKEFNSKDKLDDDVLKWDSVVLLEEPWRDLDHSQKVIRVLYEFLPSYLKVNATDDDIVNYINLTFPELEEASKRSLLSYTPLRSNASVQRQEFTVGSKRGYTATFAPSQLEHAMRYATDLGKDKRMLSALLACPWRGAKEFFKNKERDGQKWKSMVLIEDDKEVRDCMRLRKVQAVLDSSVQKGRPVMYKQVAAPFNYTGESNSYRFTTFGARNFDMTQAAPAVMDAPYVLSKKRINVKRVIDPQHSYKELKLSKKGFIEVDHDTGKRRHPIYPSRKKEKLWARVA